LFAECLGQQYREEVRKGWRLLLSRADDPMHPNTPFWFNPRAGISAWNLDGTPTPPLFGFAPHACTKELCNVSGFIELGSGVVVCRASGSVHCCSPPQCLWQTGRTVEGTACWASGWQFQTTAYTHNHTVINRAKENPLQFEPCTALRFNSIAYMRKGAETDEADADQHIRQRNTGALSSIAESAVASFTPAGGAAHTALRSTTGARSVTVRPPPLSSRSSFLARSLSPYQPHCSQPHCRLDFSFCAMSS
jgi:hypothetical protein